MTRKMVSGPHLPLPTQSTRDHGSQRFVCVETLIDGILQYVLELICLLTLGVTSWQKIKNPNYSGKWKAPLIDNPGLLFILVFTVDVM